MPFVIGSPSRSRGVCRRPSALRILRERFPQIVDASSLAAWRTPTPASRWREGEALAEATAVGFPPRAWFAYQSPARSTTVGSAGRQPARRRPHLRRGLLTVPGHLGADPPASLARARAQHCTTIAPPIAGTRPPRSFGTPPACHAPCGVWSPTSSLRWSWRTCPDGEVRAAAHHHRAGRGGQPLRIAGLQDGFVLTGVGEAHLEHLAGVVGDEVTIDNDAHLRLPDSTTATRSARTSWCGSSSASTG